MADITVEQLADAMFELVKECEGKKNLKAGDVTKMMIAKFGGNVDKPFCKQAIRTLMDSGRCVYSYFGGSYITLPKIEGADPSRSQ
jgi:hypothetical protein